MSYDTPASFAMQGFGAPQQHDLLAEKEQRIRQISLAITQEMLQKSLEAEVTAVLGGHSAVRMESLPSGSVESARSTVRSSFAAMVIIGAA
jgi:hypothetical protein